MVNILQRWVQTHPSIQQAHMAQALIQFIEKGLAPKHQSWGKFIIQTLQKTFVETTVRSLQLVNINYA